jgi:K(+)-stimulated pyrophosphate-energized sodium pump
VEVSFLSSFRDSGFKPFTYGGHVTAQGWVYFFLGVSNLSLIVAFSFAHQVIGSDIGTDAIRRLAAAIKGGSLLKRQYKMVGVALGMLFPAFAHAQPEHSGGEANLVLPDLTTVNFLGMNGHALLMFGLLHAVEELAGSPHNARYFRAHL